MNSRQADITHEILVKVIWNNKRKLGRTRSKIFFVRPMLVLIMDENNLHNEIILLLQIMIN